ncbi:MAG: hypothetical protein HY510_02150 [Acidobacteria bacterium]|nr:hypothetical protein [Acidobacteriota bacterium]
MNRNLQGLVIAVGFSLVLLPQVAPAQSRELAEARAAVKRSGDQSIDALNGALSRVSDQEARDALERAKLEVLETQNRAFRDLNQAENGSISRQDGLRTALWATEKHQEALLKAMGNAPVQAKQAIEHAMGVSAHGHNTVKALAEGTSLPAPPGPPAFDRPSGSQTRPSPIGPTPGGIGGVGRGRP